MPSKELKLKNSGSAQATPTETIHAETEGKMRLAIVGIVGVIAIIFAGGIMYKFCCEPNTNEKSWQPILQVVNGIVFALLGYIGGRKSQ